MPGKDDQAYLGGLPKLIKCSVCEISKHALSGFSSVALNQFRTFYKKHSHVAMPSGGTNVESGPKPFIRCKECTAKQPTGLTCQICFKTREFKWFSKAQRKNPDGAKCLDCMRAIQLVLPTSAEDANTEESAVAFQEPEDDDDGGEFDDVKSSTTKDYFVKKRDGQYYSKYQDDVSSVSNPWESRASSEIGYATPRSVQSGSGSLTSGKLAALDSRFRGMDINEDKGSATSKPAYSRRAVQNDSDGDDSDETARGNAKSSIKTLDKGKAVSSANNMVSEESRTSHSTLPAYDDLYDNSSDEDDDNFQFTRATNDKHHVNIYENSDSSSKASEHQDSSERSGPFANTKKQVVASGSGSNKFVNEAGYGKSGGTSLTEESFGQESTKSNTGHHISRVAASGFKTKVNNYAKSQNFGRVRPTNMLASDTKNSLVHRSNDVDEAVCRVDPAEISSDED